MQNKDIPMFCLEGGRVLSFFPEKNSFGRCQCCLVRCSFSQNDVPVPVFV